MSLLFRLLRILFASLFRKKVTSILEPTELMMRVWPTDLDLNIHLNNGRYLTIMDVGRIDLIMKVGAFGALIKGGIRPVVGSAQIQYRKPLGPLKRFRLVTEVVGWDEKWFYLRQQFHRLDGTLCADAYVRTLFLGPSGRLTSEQILALLPTEIPSSPSFEDCIPLLAPSTSPKSIAQEE